MAIELSWRFGCPPPTLRVGGQGEATQATDSGVFSKIDCTYVTFRGEIRYTQEIFSDAFAGVIFAFVMDCEESLRTGMSPSADSNIRVLVVVGHLRDFSDLVTLRILDDTEGIDPNVLNSQAPGQKYGILKGLRLAYFWGE